MTEPTPPQTTPDTPDMHPATAHHTGARAEPSVDPTPPDEHAPHGREPGLLASGPPGGGEGGEALRQALRRAVRLATVVCLLAGALTAAVAGLLVGWPGVWGAVVGVGIALAFLVTTALVGARVAGGDPLLVAGAILGSWLVKVVLLVVVLVALRGQDFYDPVALFAGVVVGMLLTLWAEYRALTSARVPYVEPRRSA